MHTKLKKIWFFYGFSTDPKLYSNKRKLSPVSKNLKVNGSLCLTNVAFLITDLFSKQKGYHLSQFNKLLIIHTHETAKPLSIVQKNIVTCTFLVLIIYPFSVSTTFYNFFFHLVVINATSLFLLHKPDIASALFSYNFYFY